MTDPDDSPISLFGKALRCHHASITGPERFIESRSPAEPLSHELPEKAQLRCESRFPVARDRPVSRQATVIRRAGPFLREQKKQLSPECENRPRRRCIAPSQRPFLHEPGCPLVVP